MRDIDKCKMMGDEWSQRFYDFIEGIKRLPKFLVDEIFNNATPQGEAGEMIFDDCSVWKRVLGYRFAEYFKPGLVVETHAGLGIGSRIYKEAHPSSQIISMTKFESEIPKLADQSIDFCDVDPFGHPYSAIEQVMPKMKKSGFILVTSGEIFQVSRGLNKACKIKTQYKGKEAWKYVYADLVPYLQELTGMAVRVLYIYHTSVRLACCDADWPDSLVEGLPLFLGKTRKHYEEGDKIVPEPNKVELNTKKPQMRGFV